MESKPQSLLSQGGTIHTTAGSRQAADIPWKDHPAFAGVALRHLITGADTDGALSCHIVHLLPGASLASHVHDGQWELHEVVEGSGTAGLNMKLADYLPGVTAVIPRGVPHEVTAGPQGLTLYAKFFPALL